MRTGAGRDSDVPGKSQVKRACDDDDEWSGTTEGRTVYIEDDESPVLGPDGEPLRYTRRAKIGFDLTPRHKRGQSR